MKKKKILAYNKTKLLRGAGEARWAHNPKDDGSKPSGAKKDLWRGGGRP